MNDHPAHRGDVVRVHPGIVINNHDLSGMHLTVQGERIGELTATEWTGGPLVIVPRADVDVITRLGVA